MGYYTYYTIFTAEKSTTHPVEEIHQPLPPHIRQHFHGALPELDDEGHFEGALKWYEHDRDMIDLSKIFTDTVFVLFGEGEDYGDVWKAYYCNGVVCHCSSSIVYDEPNWDELLKAKAKPERLFFD